MEANIGRFGPYVRYKSTFASIKEKDGDDPMTIELDRAVELIEEKLEADKNKFIATFDDEKPVIQVLNGRYGPYIKSGRRNYKIPKDVEDPKTLTREDCLAIMEEAGKKGGAKKKTTKKSSAKKSTTKKSSAKKK